MAHVNKPHILCASGTAMKAHIGVDAETGVVHTLVTTSANVSDVTQAHALLHGEELFGVGNAGYQGAEKREENQGRQSFNGKSPCVRASARPCRIRRLDGCKSASNRQGQHPGQG